MTSRSRTKKILRSNLMEAARAGLIPASDDLADEAKVRLSHAASLIRTMRRIASHAHRASDERVITDILADLRFYCATKAVSFEQLDVAAALEHEDWLATP